jgi:3-dehydroquinate synthase
VVVPIVLENTQPVSYNIAIDPLATLVFDRPVAIVTNPTVWGLHGTHLMERIEAPQIEVIQVPDGEEYKRLETVIDVLDRLFEARFDRKSLLIAFGGGVIGDMTGFAASLYQRGIDFVQIPTTLLSQVDASVGGKTGVNNAHGKNLIGAFYQPQAVYIDPYFLQTLPEREFAAGVAEVIKMAVMFDADFFHFLQTHDLHEAESIREMIRRSVELKAWVVNQDEKESGIRAVLNYGHTFGHVIENETHYETYLHGEAVAIGIVMANVLAVALGLLSQEEADAIHTLLEANGLPVTYDIKDIDAFYDHFYLDKKSDRGAITFVLPGGRIGTHARRKEIDAAVVKDALRTFGGAR